MEKEKEEEKKRDDSFLERVLELGVGLCMARQMPDFISQSMMQATQSANNLRTPPQIPKETVWYLVVDNAQAGPFNEEALKQIIQNKLITPQTLVWKAGMSQWQPASQVPEVNKLFLLAKL